MAINFTTHTELADLEFIYIGYYGRAADPAGMSYWIDQFNQTAPGTMSLSAIAASFSQQAESKALYPYLNAPNVADPGLFVDAIYQNLFNHAPDAGGRTYWIAQLNAAQGNAQAIGAMIINIISGAQGTDQTIIENKEAVAEHFTVTFANSTAIWTVADNTQSRTELAATTVDPATVTAQNLASDTFIATQPSPGQTFTLTAGIDPLASFTGTTGDDTFVGNTATGAVTFTSLDQIDGGKGNDSFNINATAAVDTTAAVGATVANIENVNITSTGTVVANTTGWTGATKLATSSVGNSTITAATTTDVTSSVGSPTGAGAAVIQGGKAVTLTMTDTAATGTASGNTTTIGTVTAPTGAVNVTQTETVTDTADAGIATGSIAIKGGTTVTVNSLASVGVGSAAADVVTIGGVLVQGTASTTAVSVTQSAATKTWATAGDLIKITDGTVGITDLNTATKSDSIATVTLSNFGASTIVGNALTTLNLTGGSASTTASGSFGISQSASLTTGAPTTLGINMTKGFVGAITDTNNQYTTLNIASAAAATIADLDFTNVTTLAVSGAGVTTISALTDLALATTITSSGGGLTLTPTIGNFVTLTGGDGKETISVGATTKAITTGGGDDNVTVTVSALGSGGTIDAGLGSDTLTMSAANAATASAGTTFATKISGFDKLSLTGATTNVVDLANLDNINDISIATIGTSLTLNNVATGVNVRFADATQTAAVVALASNGSADVANIFLTQADGSGTTVGALTLTGFETIAFNTADTQAIPTGLTAHTVTTLTDADATAITVAGNNGLTIGTFAGTKLVSFDASGVTLGAVSFTSGALAGAATITGGAGADTLNAANAVASVTINGNAGNDLITGSATKASTLNGGSGNDTITGGAAADTVDGGTGTNSFVFSSAAIVEQAGSGTTLGTIINLGATAVSQSDVFAATGQFLSATAPSVAAGTATYLFSNESTTNAVVVDTLANIQSATGTAGKDYIVANAAGGTITGGTGADALIAGAGVDTFVFVAGDGVTATASGVAGGTASIWDVGETLTFGNGLDVITGFTAGVGGDVIKGYNAGAPTAALSLAAGATTGLATGTTYYLSGAFDAATGIFTVAANGAGASTLIIEGHGTAQTVNVDMIMLVGVNSANLDASNLVA